MSSKPLQQELVATLFGLHANAEGAMRVSALVGLMADLGIDGGAARSTVSRLKAKGILQRTAGRGAPSYVLSEVVLDAFNADDQRIFAPERSHLGDPWALVVFSVPESERNRRYELRSELISLGFGFVAAGVAIAPLAGLEQALKRLQARGLDRYVEQFHGHYGEGRRLRDRVGKWWDLGALDAQYAEFLADYRGDLNRWRASSAQAPDLSAAERKDAFALYVPLLTRWRRFPYRDPNIPLELLPVGWKAPRAKLMFLELHSILKTPAADHASVVLERAT